VGERIAMGDLRTARLGHGLAGSSHDGAEPRIASVGCRGRLIQSLSHQDSVISHDEILPCRTLQSGNLCLRDPNHGPPGPTSDWHPGPARADPPRGDYSNRHTARFITITDTTLEVEGDVMRTQVACRKRTANRDHGGVAIQAGAESPAGSSRAITGLPAFARFAPRPLFLDLADQVSTHVGEGMIKVALVGGCHEVRPSR
jgi:hypothetical protein